MYLNFKDSSKLNMRWQWQAQWQAKPKVIFKDNLITITNKGIFYFGLHSQGAKSKSINKLFSKWPTFFIQHMECKIKEQIMNTKLIVYLSGIMPYIHINSQNIDCNLIKQ
jgi:hypothetical protein